MIVMKPWKLVRRDSFTFSNRVNLVGIEMPQEIDRATGPADFDLIDLLARLQTKVEAQVVR